MKSSKNRRRSLIGLIPARGGSKKISHKNLADLGGHPLISYSIAACNLCPNITRTIVSTDDKEIAEIAIKYGAEIPFMRPPEFASDTSPDTDFLLHFFNIFPVEEVALVRPTTPFRDVEFMTQAIDAYFSEKDSITGLRSVEDAPENPYKLFRIENNICHGFFTDYQGNPDYTNLPRQTFPKAFRGNGHIDIVKKETVLKGSAFGETTLALNCPKVIDIDNVNELEYARATLASDNKLLSYLTRNAI